MAKYLILFLGLFSFTAFGQKNEYQIEDFSDKYYAKLNIATGYEEEVFKKAVVSILTKTGNQEIIKIESDELVFEMDDQGKLRTNIVQVPYGEQSVIISQDFNFDGKKDLAVMDGQFSCYHGPSFKIYLEKKGGLEYSEAFSRLAHEYCGMFQLETENQTIHTMTKSGCCWHQMSVFKVVNDEPTPIKIIEEDATDFPFFSTKTIEWQNGKKKESTKKTIEFTQGELSKLMTFKLARNQKEVVVFGDDKHSNQLYYALLKPSGTVEFSFPINRQYDRPDFELNPSAERLTFANGNTTYQIYEKRQAGKLLDLGILVTFNGKKYNLKGDLSSINGSLKEVQQKNFDNLKKE